MWFDYITSGVPDFAVGDAVCHQPCKTFWNQQYLLDYCMSTLCTCAMCLNGFNYMVNDDTKRAGFRVIGTDRSCQFIVNEVCYPILYATQTRGSGAPLNTQNSIHIAYFDLIPYRCTVLAGGFGFFANGNACPGPTGTTCCLKFSKLDTFFNS
jgi:hypothetical protein